MNQMWKFVLILVITFISGKNTFLTAQDNYKVRKVIFQGNKSLEKEFLLERLAVTEVSFLEEFLTDKEAFLYNEELIQLDLDRLVRVYQREGFLNVETRLEPLKINNKRQTVKVVFGIDEGEPVRVDTILFRFENGPGRSDADSLAKMIRKDLKLNKKDRFRDESLKKDIQIAEDFFRNRGYAYVKVDDDLDLQPGELKTGITYIVNRGPVCHVGETTIRGNENYSDEFIRKQLTYEKGEVYNKSDLSNTRQYLYNLQLFRVVSVIPEKKPETRLSPIPVDIYIEEAPKLSTRVGAGYGTEDKFRAFLDVNHRGLFGGARRINLYVKHSALEPYSINLRWIQPQFLGKKSTIILNPFINSIDEPGYETRTYGINIPYTYRHNNLWNSSATYYYENVEQTIEDEDEELAYIEDDKFPYNKSGILLSTIYDNSRPRFSPEEGMNISLGFKLNGYLFGGTFSYTRLWGDFRKYYDLGPAVLAFRFMAGGIHSSDTSRFIPVDDRFYSGGSTSVRGWSRSELGPERQSGTPLGGKSIIESSLEIRYFLFWRLSLAGFVDAGNVWRNSYSYRLNELAYAVGGGLRVETPIGPVRFDIGVPVFNEKKNPQFFLSVGQAF